MSQSEKPIGPKKILKGGRKGGTLFPKINLKQALEYAKKLVSKTHTGAQPEKVILPGVFGNAGPLGKVRASALKQYGLLEGPASAYNATKLAKDIDASIDHDSPALLQRAFLSSKLFNQIFEVFHGDAVSKAKIEQRAKGLQVHPESAGECAQLFIDSAVTAKLGKLSGDSISLVRSGKVALASDTEDETTEVTTGDTAAVAAAPKEPVNRAVSDDETESLTAEQRKPGVTLNLSVDPSSDPDKLERQLKLLRQYGII